MGFVADAVGDLVLRGTAVVCLGFAADKLLLDEVLGVTVARGLGFVGDTDFDLLVGIVLRGFVGEKLLQGTVARGLSFMADTVGDLLVGIVFRGTTAVGLGFVGEKPICSVNSAHGK